MPFVKRDSEKEKVMLEELEKDIECRKIGEEFEREYEFRKSLILARKEKEISQKELSKLTGLTQQMISRIETGYNDANINTVMKYLAGLGYSLKIVKND